MAAESMNKGNLREECRTKIRGEFKQKTKTRTNERIISDCVSTKAR